MQTPPIHHHWQVTHLLTGGGARLGGGWRRWMEGATLGGGERTVLPATAEGGGKLG